MTEIKNPSIIDFSDIDDDQMNALIDGTLTDFDEGDLVDGTVVKIEHDEVLVDIGFKSEGVIPLRELSIRKDADPSDIVNLGDKIEALVLQKEDKDGRLILSKKRAEYERAWISVEEKFKAGETVTGEVIEVVKGGLILDIGLRGFLPASLVDLRRVKDLDMYLGTELEARVIEMDRNRNNVVLSRRVLLEEGRKNERAEILREKGTNRAKFFRGQVDKYTWVDFGDSYLPSELNAAYLWAQLLHADEINENRLTSWHRYREAFLPLAEAGKIELQHIPAECTHNAHMFYLKCKNLEERTEFIRFLKENDILAVFHYIPLHSAPAGEKFGRFDGEDVYTTAESERLVRLPMYYSLTEDDQNKVIAKVLEFYEK